jgi:predicted AlkP superfamily phosphohydrolase/phosphomutase
MFMRFISRDHPADRCSLDREKYKGVIEDLYKRMDDLIGRVVEKMDDKDVLMVISDHGFKPFKRGVNLNTWLYKNGYLALKDKKKAGGEKWFRDLDWERTKAYTFGLTGIYINEKGREAKGVVTPGEKEELKEELIKKLSGLKDDDNGDVAIRNVYNTTECYDGPYLENGPDIIIGYNEGYRASWGAAVGSVDEKVFEDNKKSWSGDHCMDPQLVPGVLFCNKKISRDAPHILDIGPTVVDLFGIKVPEYMQGRPLIAMKRTEGEDQGDE